MCAESSERRGRFCSSAFGGTSRSRPLVPLPASSSDQMVGEDFTKSIETEPYTADARYNLAICKMQTEDYEGAIAIFTEYIDGNKAAEGANETEQAVNYGAYYYRAVCNAALAKLEEAIADYTVCIEQQYEPAQSYYQRAQIYAALGDTEKKNADLAESLKYTN